MAVWRVICFMHVNVQHAKAVSIHCVVDLRALNVARLLLLKVLALTCFLFPSLT